MMTRNDMKGLIIQNCRVPCLQNLKNKNCIIVESNFKTHNRKQKQIFLYHFTFFVCQKYLGNSLILNSKVKTCLNIHDSLQLKKE